MYNINYYLTRFLISRIFPYLPFLFGIFLFLVLKFFEPAYLCDGESIEELKNRLTEETTIYNKAMEELDDLVDKMKVAEEEKKYDLAYSYDLKSE
jgi:hypothetical protein